MIRHSFTTTMSWIVLLAQVMNKIWLHTLVNIEIPFLFAFIVLPCIYSAALLLTTLRAPEASAMHFNLDKKQQKKMLSYLFITVSEETSWLSLEFLSGMTRKQTGQHHVLTYIHFVIHVLCNYFSRSLDRTQKTMASLSKSIQRSFYRKHWAHPKQPYCYSPDFVPLTN